MKLAPPGLAGILIPVVALILTGHLAAQTESNLFQIIYRDGSILVCELDDRSFDWNEVSDDGNVTRDQIQTSAVNQIRFSESTVSQQVARIKLLINQLQDPVFAKRAEAESELQKIAGPFQQILKNSLETENIEARYRLKRLLKHLGRETGQAQASYDLLVFNDGKLAKGDSPGLKLAAQHYGQSITVARDQLLQIRRVPPAKSDAPDLVAGYRTVSQPIDSYYDSTMRVANFEEAENQTSLRVGTLLNEIYAYLGCTLRCEGEENDVKVDSYDVTGRSSRQCGVCYDYSYSGNAKYKGVFRVEFCLPGQPNIQATTRRAGCFLQMVNPPRTIVVEAYNRDHECIGICEAIESTAFTGLQSDHGIAYLRILSNKHLRMLNDAEPDNDFAVDDLTFEPTRRDLTSAFENEYAVNLKQGDLLRCRSIAVNDGVIKITGLTCGRSDMEIELSQVRSIAPPRSRRLERSIQHEAFARLNDGSVVAFRKIGAGGIVDFPRLAVDKQNTCGIWGRDTLCRYAHVDDYQTGKEVIVFPAHRQIVEEVELGEKISWDRSKVELAKQVFDQFEDVRDPDYPAEYELAESPTIWFRAPLPENPDDGMLRTTDGQRFALGGKIGFRVTEWNQDSLTLQNGNDKVSIPMTQVRSLILPK